jgi:hypothetical protein
MGFVRLQCAFALAAWPGVIRTPTCRSARIFAATLEAHCWLTEQFPKRAGASRVILDFWGSSCLLHGVAAMLLHHRPGEEHFLQIPLCALFMPFIGD